MSLVLPRQFRSRVNEPSRLYDDANAQEDYVDTVVVTGEPISMACWFYMDTLVTGALVNIGRSASTGRWRLNTVNSGVVQAAKQNDAGSTGAAGLAGLLTGSWMHAGATFISDTSRALFLNGEKKTNATSIIDPTIELVSVGGTKIGSGPTNPFSGNVFWPCFWDVVLADGEMIALSQGSPPWRIRPMSIVSMPNMRTLYDPGRKVRGMWSQHGTGTTTSRPGTPRFATVASHRNRPPSRTLYTSGVTGTYGAYV